MVSSNPNSNLVFDFPDPSPRFEFDDFGPNNIKNEKGSNTKRGGFGSKKKKFGKYSNRNNQEVDDDNSPSKRSTGTASTSSSMSMSMNSSLDSNNFGESFFISSSSNNGGFGFDNNDSPLKLKARNNCGDFAAGPQQHHRQQQQRGGGGKKNHTTNASSATLPHFDFSPPPPSPSNLTLPKPTYYGHHSRDASAHSAASSTGYISEVSEFSFDRVTVTTNESGAAGTHQSSNDVSWNFMNDDTVLNAVGAFGGGQDGDDGNGKFVPFTNDDADDDAAAASSNTIPVSGRSRNEAVVAAAAAAANHRPIRSSSTFSNVSVSDDEDMDFDAVDALLMEGMESARRTTKKHFVAAAAAATSTTYQESLENHATTNSARESINDRSKRGKIKEGRTQEGGSIIIAPSRNTAAAKSETKPAKSTNNTNNMGDKSKVFLTDIRTTYAKFKTERSNSNNSNSNNNGQNENKPSMLQSIMDDVQFLGLYFCATDTTVTGGNDDENKRN